VSVSARGWAIAPVALVASLWLVAAPRTPARACGQCIEDKIAATYDHAVLTRAARDGHVVVFADIRGPAAGAGPALKAFIVRTLASTRGIDVGTVRVSLDPPAASFACDPARHAPKELLASVNPRLATKGLRLAVIEIDRGPRPD
jgi:hypothetical protein